MRYVHNDRMTRLEDPDRSGGSDSGDKDKQEVE